MNDQQLKQALLGHRLVIANVLIFHLPMPVLAFGISFMREVILFSLFVSFCIFTFLAKRSKNTETDEFISSHWKIAFERARYLLIGYVISVSILGLGWIMIAMKTDPQMKEILQTAFVHIATVPILFPALFVLVLQARAISKAKRGLIP